MSHIENTESHPKRSTGARTFLLIAGAVTSLIAIGLVAFGGLALWGDSQKDERGYLSTTATASRRARMRSPRRTSTWTSMASKSWSTRPVSATSASTSCRSPASRCSRGSPGPMSSPRISATSHTPGHRSRLRTIRGELQRPGRAGHAGCARGRADLGSVQPGCRTADPHLGYRGRRMVDRRHERRRHVWRTGRHQRRGEGPVPERDRLERPRRRSDPAHRRGRAARLRPTPTPPAAPNGARRRLGPDRRLIPRPRIRPCCTEGPSL